MEYLNYQELSQETQDTIALFQQGMDAKGRVLSDQKSIISAWEHITFMVYRDLGLKANGWMIEKGKNLVQQAIKEG